MPKHKPLPPVELLRERLHYDSATGQLTWVKPASTKMKPGDRAGWTGGNRRIYVRFNGDFLVHRVAWAMHHGVDPGETEIDHVNGDPSDNRIDNLRLATRFEQMRNTRKPVDNRSGVKGVCWDKQHQKWRARVGSTFLGIFPTLEEAAATVRAARENIHGEFAHHG
jgi:hypothetical protein